MYTKKLLQAVNPRRELGYIRFMKKVPYTWNEELVFSATDMEKK